MARCTHTLHYCFLGLVLIGFGLPLHAAELKTRNVLIVMTDGLRWQEVFDGAEDAAARNDKQNSVTVTRTYCQGPAESRRRILLPFMWETVAQQGQIYGNRTKGSTAKVTNAFKFSFPGYSETLIGYADPRVNSNDAINNPNETVFEWVNKLPGFEGKVAAFGAWARFEHVFSASRCGFLVNWGYQPLTTGKTNERIAFLNRLKAETFSQPWDQPHDTITYHTALEYLKENKPRAFFLALGETDEWGHQVKYLQYLVAGQRYDAFLKELWDTVQSMPEYKDQTTLIMLTDHGRGDGARWSDHNETVPNAEYMWMAILGPDTPALGEMQNVPDVTQGQVAATFAALLGLDYRATVPAAAPPIAAALPPAEK